MRIKKKTSIMMATATTLAAVGIAAVSFAAWTGSSNSVTADASTGTAYLYGFATNELSFNTPLVPYDQDMATVTSGEKVSSENLPAFVVDERDFTVSLDNVTITSDNTTAAFTVYVQVTTSNTAPALMTKNDDGTVNAGGWKEIGVNCIYTFTSTGTADAITVIRGEDGTVTTPVYIYLALASDDDTARSQTFTFDITLAPVAE